MDQKLLQNYFNLSKNTLFLFILCSFFYYCKQQPEFSSTPSIKYEYINKLSFGNQDSVNIGLLYKDGDGDLGLDESDVNGTSLSVSEYKYNYFVNIEILDDGAWEMIDFNALGFPEQHSRFPRLLPEGEGPIEGLLNWAYRIPLSVTSVFDKGDTIRFEIYILDRSLNQSNIIVTDSIILGD